MPFTPLHLGLGALCKAIGGDRFSFMVFGGAQVLMDIEVLVRMDMESTRLHGVSHTVLGALIIGALAAVSGKPITEYVLRVSGAARFRLTWGAALTAAFAGTFSHIALDAIMHSDVQPGWPIVSGSPLLGLVSPEALFYSCVISGLIGAVAFLLLRPTTK